jgi:hypothetical protein
LQILIFLMISWTYLLVWPLSQGDGDRRLMVFTHGLQEKIIDKEVLGSFASRT